MFMGISWLLVKCRSLPPPTPLPPPPQTLIQWVYLQVKVFLKKETQRQDNVVAF